MKKRIALLLALSVILTLAACGSPRGSVAGTWTGKLDLKELMRGRLDEILDYLENTDVEVTLVMREDKTFSMTLDYSGIVSAVQEAVTAFLTDRLNSMGITLEQYEQIAGTSLEATIEEFMQKMDNAGLSQSVAGTYTENRGSLVFTAREFNGKGAWEGERLSLNAGALGELVLTRKP